MRRLLPATVDGMASALIADQQFCHEITGGLKAHEIADGLSPQWDVSAVYMSRATWQQFLTEDGYRCLMSDTRTTLFGLDCLIDDRMRLGAYVLESA